MRKIDNVLSPCAVVTKSTKLKFLEPSGPLQACNGTALPFYQALKKAMVDFLLYDEIVEVIFHLL